MSSRSSTKSPESSPVVGNVSVLIPCPCLPPLQMVHTRNVAEHHGILLSWVNTLFLGCAVALLLQEEFETWLLPVCFIVKPQHWPVVQFYIDMCCGSLSMVRHWLLCAGKRNTRCVFWESIGEYRCNVSITYNQIDHKYELLTRNKWGKLPPMVQIHFAP